MNELVLSGPLLLAAAVAALAGLVSFASPCVLPLVPGFLGYLGGMTPARPGPARPPPGSGAGCCWGRACSSWASASSSSP
ncbi:cytochrome c biogenesis protein CcdA [Ornithinimicrobium flavum]|uniref:cytochrome c biogenesis protein CcdA n=1 Tax=Ornithinimicrobium flavum TaxID=1288636 RepID=UPI003084596D